MNESEAKRRASERSRRDWGPILSKLARSVLGLSPRTELLLAGIVEFMRDLSAKVEAEARSSRADLEKRFGEGTRDIVEEASWESFPASDAPPR